MTDAELLVFRTAALNRTVRSLGLVRELALDAKRRRGLVDADDILLLTASRVQQYP